MKVKGLLGAALGMFLLTGSLSAQFSVEKIQPDQANDRIPFYLDAKFTKQDLDKYTANEQVLYPVPIPAEVYKMPPGPAKLLSASGVQLRNISTGAAGHQSETWITIDPNNPDNIIATANDMRYMSNPFHMSAWYSKDGGKTWKHSLTPNANGIHIDIAANESGTIFDPGIGFNSQGEALYLYGFTITKGDDGHGDNGVFITRSTDGGESWGDDAVVWQNDGEVFNDRFSMAVDYQENSPYKDYVYVSWARMSSPNKAVIAAAESFEDFYKYETLWSQGGIQSPVPAIGPDGTVYCVWQHIVYGQVDRKTEAMISKSTDGGKVWSTPRVAQTVFNTGSPNDISSRYVLADKRDMRVSSVPYLDVDKSNSPRRGWVYVIQSGRESEQGPNGLYLTYSSDGGTNWVESMRIDENEVRNDIFFPSISIDPKTGDIAILYYSSQNDPTNNQGVDAFIAISKDGINFKHIQLTDTWYLKDANDVVPQGPGNFYWGDYTSLVFFNGKIHPCFWMPTAENANAYSVDLFTADLVLGINAVSDLVAENVEGAETGVKLQWVNPTKDLFGFDLDNYKLHIIRDDQKIGELDPGTTQFLDPNVEDGVVYNYGVKLVTDNAESKIMYVTIQAGGSVTPAMPELIAAKPVANGIELTWKNPATTNKGNEINGTLSLVILSDGEEVATIEDNLTPGTTTTKVIESLNLKTLYNISIKSKITRDEAVGESNETNTLLTYAGSPFDTFQEGFEEELIPMYIKGTWGTTTLAAAGGSLAFTESPVGDYKNLEEYYFVTAPVEITSAPAVIAWDYISIINKRHYMKVLASNDNGQTWEHLNWTNIETSDKFKKDVNESEWLHISYDMKKFFNEGDIVFFKFVLDNSASGNPYDGYYLDNLEFGDFPVTVNDMNVSLSNLTVAPNPAANFVDIKFSSKDNHNAKFAIVDMLGNQVADLGSYASSQSESSLRADVSNLANGAYILKVEIDGAIQSTSFVISR